MVIYTTTAFYISPSGKLVKQTYTFTQVNKDIKDDSVSVTTPQINIQFF